MSEVVQPYTLLEQAVERNPRRLAFADGTLSISVSDLRNTVYHLAAAIRKRGVRPGDIVALNLSPAAAVAFSLTINHEGAVQCGWVPALAANNSVGVSWLATHVPVDGFPLEQQIVVDEAFYADLERYDQRVEPRPFTSPDDLYRIAFSSGTTGRPKAVPFSVQHNLDRAVQSVERWTGTGAHMSWLAPRVGVGWHSWYASLARDEPYLAPSTVEANVALMKEFAVESIVGTPVHFTELTRYLHSNPTELPSFRFAAVVGSTAAPDLVRNLGIVSGARVGNIYSSTEFGGVALRHTAAADPNYMGEILHEVELQIVDETTHEPLKDEQVGLVRVRRPGMVTGYLDDPEATSVAFRDGWFYPGDRGVRRGNKLFLAGRASEVINASGAKIDPTEIEKAFRGVDEILDCAAFAVTGKQGLVKVGIAYVSAMELDDAALLTQMQAKLGNAVPVVYRRVESIPRNDMGKVLRNELSERFSER